MRMSRQSCLRGSGRYQNLKDGIFAYYTLNGNAYDSTINSRDGIVYGATQITGKIDEAYSFDGTNDYIEISSFPFPANSPITISFWTYVPSGGTPFTMPITNDLDNPNRIFCHAPAYGDVYWDYGNDGWGTGNGRVFVSYDGYYDKWTHVVLVSSGSAATFQAIYLDGSLAISKDSSTGQSGTSKLLINKRTYEDTQYGSGSVDEIGIWTRMLSLSEIQQLYNSGSGIRLY